MRGGVGWHGASFSEESTKIGSKTIASAGVFEYNINVSPRAVYAVRRPVAGVGRCDLISRQQAGAPGAKAAGWQ